MQDQEERSPENALPGNQLHLIIVELFAEGPTWRCGCEDRREQMNAWGIAGCRQHIETIVLWLLEQIAAHDWIVVDTDPYGHEVINERTPPLVVRLAQLTLKIPGGKFPVRWRCRQLIELAIRRAERAARIPATRIP